MERRVFVENWASIVRCLLGLGNEEGDGGLIYPVTFVTEGIRQRCGTAVCSGNESDVMVLNHKFEIPIWCPTRQ